MSQYLNFYTYYLTSFTAKETIQTNQVNVHIEK